MIQRWPEAGFSGKGKSLNELDRSGSTSFTKDPDARSVEATGRFVKSMSKLDVSSGASPSQGLKGGGTSFARSKSQSIPAKKQSDSKDR